MAASTLVPAEYAADDGYMGTNSYGGMQPDEYPRARRSGDNWTTLTVLARVWKGIESAYRKQLRLHQIYLNRNDVSGLDALAVAYGRTLEQSLLEDIYLLPSKRRSPRRPGKGMPA